MHELFRLSLMKHARVLIRWPLIFDERRNKISSLLFVVPVLCQKLPILRFLLKGDLLRACPLPKLSFFPLSLFV